MAQKPAIDMTDPEAAGLVNTIIYMTRTLGMPLQSFSGKPPVAKFRGGVHWHGAMLTWGEGEPLVSLLVPAAPNELTEAQSHVRHWCKQNDVRCVPEAI